MILGGIYTKEQEIIDCKLTFNKSTSYVSFTATIAKEF